MKEGKITSYALYALGEIILVMIGILLALQVNNWNDGRKERKQEQYYLQALKEELNDNKTKIGAMIEFQKAQLQRATLLMDVLNNDTIVTDLQSLHIAIMHVGWAVNPVFDDIVWSELLNTGKLICLENHDLRNRIAEFYKDTREYVKNESEWSGVNLEYRERTNGVLPSKLRAAIGDVLGYYKIKGLVEGQLMTQNEIVNNITKVENAEGLISDVIINRKTSIFFTEELLQNANHLLSLLEKEIGY